MRDLTDHSKGNAAGIGLADYTHSRLVAKIDRSVTHDNCITAANPRSAATPIHFDRDIDLLNAALKTIGRSKTDQARIVWIRNTLDLETVRVPESAGRPDGCGDDRVTLSLCLRCLRQPASRMGGIAGAGWDSLVLNCLPI